MDMQVAILLVQEGMNANELAEVFGMGRTAGESLYRETIRKMDNRERAIRHINTRDRQIAAERR